MDKSNERLLLALRPTFYAKVESIWMKSPGVTRKTTKWMDVEFFTILELHQKQIYFWVYDSLNFEKLEKKAWKKFDFFYMIGHPPTFMQEFVRFV